jgi:hypothetical protein
MNPAIIKACDSHFSAWPWQVDPHMPSSSHPEALAAYLKRQGFSVTIPDASQRLEISCHLGACEIRFGSLTAYRIPFANL